MRAKRLWAAKLRLMRKLYYIFCQHYAALQSSYQCRANLLGLYHCDGQVSILWVPWMSLGNILSIFFSPIRHFYKKSKCTPDRFAREKVRGLLRPTSFCLWEPSMSSKCYCDASHHWWAIAFCSGPNIRAANRKTNIATHSPAFGFAKYQNRIQFWKQ